MPTPSNTPSTSRNYFAPLTGLRAIAAGLVVFFHYWESGRVFHDGSLPILTWLMGNGQNGVTIFFVLSGFLITIRYHRSLSQGGTSFREYWLKRFVRIYPVYFFALIFLVIVPELMTGNTAYQNIWSLLGLLVLAQGFFLPLFPLGIPVGWTLTVEEIYYLVAPRMADWLGGHSTQTPRRVSTPILRGIALAIAAVLIFGVTLLVPVLTQFTGYNTEFLYSVSFFIRLPEFIAGAVCGLIFLEQRGRIEQHASTLATLSIPFGIVLLQAANHFFLQHDFPTYATFRLLGGICAGLFMLGISCGGTNVVSQWLGSPIVEYLGKTSYALYLVHLTWPMQKLYDALVQLPLHPVAIAPLMYGASVLLSMLLYEWIEQPMHRWLSARLFTCTASSSQPR